MKSETFQVKSGALFASDPCYGIDTWCAGELSPALNGEWKAHVEISDEGAWGKRVKSLTVCHTGYHKKVTEWIDSEGDFGVDSGQFGFFDKRYFVDHEDEREYGEPGFYQECCDATHNEKDRSQVAGAIGNAGFVSSSGFGDGSYRVQTSSNSDGIIVAAKVIFIEDENEEEEIEEKEEENA